MRLKLRKGKQNWLLEEAISKAGSERKLKTILNIPNQTISRYRREKDNLSEDRFKIITNFLDLDKKFSENLIDKKFKEN